MICFFASPIGLGHATRDLAIAERLRSNGKEIRFVSGMGAADLLAKSGFDTLDVYRPAKFDVNSGHLEHSFRWLLNYYSYYKKCKEIARGVLEKHDGLIVSDEDFASIAIGEELGQRRVLITDIIETRFTAGAASILEKRMNKAMKRMMQACDCVIMPEVGHDEGNLRRVGPIVRQASSDRGSLRAQFGFYRKTIVLSIGGTEAGRFLLEKAIEAYRRVAGRIDADLVVVSGPAVHIPDASDYRNLGFVHNLHELVLAADLVISLAGRSTMDESIAFGTPGIFIPIKNHFEQEQGAARLGYSHEDIFRLEVLIEEKLSGERPAGTVAQGAEIAAQLIADHDR